MNDRRNTDPVERETTGSPGEVRRSWSRPIVTRLEAGKAENFASTSSDGVSTQS